MLDLSVVVPVRNAEGMLDECLGSIVASQPREIIVVDGLSTDRTRDIAESYDGVRVLSDDGRGVAAARLIGAQDAACSRVAFIDADVVLPDGALASLLDEFERDGYAGLQAGLRSVSGDGYWGRALADHHRSGRSKRWFGVVATIIDRDTILRHGFDERFTSGEDIDLRWRLRQAGAKLGVSEQTVVEHRFDDTYAFAKGQWLADGHGLGRMVRRHGLRGNVVALLPLAAAVRGALLSLARRQPQWIPYYACFLVFNYVALVRELASRRGRTNP